jgi:hypothetical protein
MMDLYIKAADKAALEKALSQFRGKDDNDKDVWKGGSKDYALDIISDDYENDCEVDKDGNVTKKPTKRNGYFAMIRCTQEVADLIPKDMIWGGTRPNRVWFKKDE